MVVRPQQQEEAYLELQVYLDLLEILDHFSATKPHYLEERTHYLVIIKQKMEEKKRRVEMNNQKKIMSHQHLVQRDNKI